jgi:Tol biopolymer transport system component
MIRTSMKPQERTRIRRCFRHVMKSTASIPSPLVFVAITAISLVGATAANVQLLSTPASGHSPPNGAGGDSGASIVTPDGRFVVFASTAANLVTLGSNQPIPSLIPPPLNIFLRDRTKGTTTLISVAASGAAGGDGDSLPAGISSNGQFVVFESAASNLIAGDTNGSTDIFVRDVLAGKTLLVSANTNGITGDGSSRRPTMTPDGRWVAFLSDATDLVARDTNNLPDVFVRDMVSEVTTLVSVDTGRQLTSPNPVLIGLSDPAPEISADGRYVIFQQTTASTLTELFARDLQNNKTLNVSAGGLALLPSLLGTTNSSRFDYAVSQAGTVVYEASPVAAPAGALFQFGLSSGETDVLYTNVAALTEDNTSLDLTPDGRVAVFVTSPASGLGNAKSVMRWDASTGNVSLVSGDTNGAVPFGSVACNPAVSPDGTMVVFLSDATNFVTNALAPGFHVYVRSDTEHKTTLVDDGAKILTSLPVPAMSADAAFVVFEADSDDVFEGNTGQNLQVFLRNLANGAPETISSRAPELPSMSPNGPSLLSAQPLSANGRYLAFSSEATDLVDNDTNGMRDVFVHDGVTGSNFLVSVGLNASGIGDSISTEPLISADGRYVAFNSTADNLVEGDTNQASDVFIRDLQTGSTVLASINATGTGPGNTGSYLSALSRDGRFLLFRSSSANLVPNTLFRGENLFWRDLQAGKTFNLTSFGLASSYAGCLDRTSGSTMTPDGRFVTFLAASASFNANPTLFVWDAQAGAIVYSNSTPPTSLSSSFSRIKVSPDGRWILYSYNLPTNGVYALDWKSKTNVLVTRGFPASRSGWSFSSDSRFLVYSARPGPADLSNQIFLWDFVNETNLLVSRSLISGGASSGNSDSPAISADNRYIAYCSSATDLVPGATNGIPQIFLFDRINSTTTLITPSYLGLFGAGSYSTLPSFSDDSSLLVFQSLASDLVGFDFNHANDVFGVELMATNAIVPFHASVSSGLQSPTISWPAVPGRTYLVQFKDNLSDQTWQNLPAGIAINGASAFLQDTALSSTHRFYRIVVKP